MVTPKRSLEDPHEADYETLSYAAAALEKQRGSVVFDTLSDPRLRGAATVVLEGGEINTVDLGRLLWYVADILEDANRRVG